MSPATLMIIAFLLALAVMSFAFAGGAVIVVIPIVLLGIAGVALMDFRRRREQSQSLGEFRDNAAAQEVDFTERDKETLSSE